ncbi:hypothetical protein J3E72DRAFT_273587 [Bipolaris maydis]|nr:hypothetical protein J3E72DRAFT_273972 [Bipolaris maydis]KAJ6192234.1 hypothetical protein J3E72DRAFT_273587 [Bipolaris maydis]
MLVLPWPATLGTALTLFAVCCGRVIVDVRRISTAMPDIRELRSVVAGQQTPPSSENFGVAPWSSAPPSSTLVLPSAPTFIISGLHHCDISLSANYDCALSKILLICCELV